MTTKTNGALAGFVAAAMVSMDRYDAETQRRLRRNQDDSRDALDQIQDYKSNGEQIRGRLPVVMDAQLGLGLANPSQVTAEILPTTTKLVRPGFDEESVSDLTWPPRAGTYDAKGRVSEIGEMTRTFLALTFQEVRAFLEGLAQPKAPSQAGLLQVSRAANQLIAVAASLNLSVSQYASAWQKLFSGLPPSTPDPHLGTPVIGTPNGANNVASVAFVPSSVTTDRAMRIRVTAGAGGNINTGSDVVTIIFASEWKDSAGNPVIPAIVGSQGIFASGSSSTGCTIQVSQGIPLNSSQDFSILVNAGGSSGNNLP